MNSDLGPSYFMSPATPCACIFVCVYSCELFFPLAAPSESTSFFHPSFIDPRFPRERMKHKEEP